MGSHKLVVDRRVIEKDLEIQADHRRYSFVQQLTRLSRERDALPNDDRVEAVAMACQYWVEKMNRDSDRELERFKDKRRQAALDDFMDHVFDVSSKPKRTGNTL